MGAVESVRGGVEFAELQGDAGPPGAAAVGCVEEEGGGRGGEEGGALVGEREGGAGRGGGGGCGFGCGFGR